MVTGDVRHIALRLDFVVTIPSRDLARLSLPSPVAGRARVVPGERLVGAYGRARRTSRGRRTGARLESRAGAAAVCSQSAGGGAGEPEGKKPTAQGRAALKLQVGRSRFPRVATTRAEAVGWPLLPLLTTPSGFQSPCSATQAGLSGSQAASPTTWRPGWACFRSGIQT